MVLGIEMASHTLREQINFGAIIVDCLHLGKKYQLKAHTKNPDL